MTTAGIEVFLFSAIQSNNALGVVITTNYNRARLSKSVTWQPLQVAVCVILYCTENITDKRSNLALDEVDHPFRARIYGKWTSRFPEGAFKPHSNTCENDANPKRELPRYANPTTLFLS